MIWHHNNIIMFYHCELHKFHYGRVTVSIVKRAINHEKITCLRRNYKPIVLWHRSHQQTTNSAHTRSLKYYRFSKEQFFLSESFVISLFRKRLGVWGFFGHVLIFLHNNLYFQITFLHSEIPWKISYFGIWN
jgi:hypothetical protein